MLIRALTDDVKAECLKALGCADEWAKPAWPLPNMKPSDENHFWGWRATYSFNAEINMMQTKIGDEYATILIYYIGHSSFIDGGFAVAVFRGYREERVEYYEWRACVHDFSEKNIGNCLNRYTCRKCGKSYDVDSSG